MQAPPPERAVLDASALLGIHRRDLVAAAALHYYQGFWSPWIISAFVRKRTEWIARRAVRDGVTQGELRRRFYQSRQRVNVLVLEMSRALGLVESSLATPVDLSWLADEDDYPIIQTAIAVNADTLVTDNSKDFPPGSVHHGVTFFSSQAFLETIYSRYPDAKLFIGNYRSVTGRPE